MSLAFVGFFVLLVAVFAAGAFVSFKKPARKPDPELGIGVGALVLGVVLLALIVFAPARKGASPSSAFYLAGVAIMLVFWGITRLGRAARRQTRRRARGNDRNET